MATVQMNRFAAEAGRMPPVCICCGSQAQQHVRHTFYYQPTWLVLVYILLPRPLKWYLSSNPAAVTVPVCAAHRKRLKWPTYLGYTLAAGLLLMVPALLTASIAGWHTAMGVMALFLLAWTIGLWATSVIVTLMTPRAEHYTTSLITLTAVSHQFAHALQGGGAGMQQAARPLPGLGGPKTAGGLTQGMLALLILGGGFVAILVFGFVLGFASYYARKARLREMQEIAQRPMEPAAWTPPNIAPPMPPPHFGGNNPLLPGAPPGTFIPPRDAVIQPSAAEAVTPGPNIPSAPVTPEPVIAPAADRSDIPWNENGRMIPANPVGGMPTVVPAGSMELTASTPLTAGTRVWLLRGGIIWVPGLVLESAGDQVKIHTPPAPAQFAEHHSRSELRLAAGHDAVVASNTSSNPAASAPIPTIGSGATRGLSNSTFGEGTSPIAGPNPPPGSLAVTPETSLQRGTQVWHLWQSQWYPAEVLSTSSTQVKIHYYNYSSTFDEEVPRSELRLPGPSPAGGGTSPENVSSSPDRNNAEDGLPKDPDVRTWTDSTGKFTIEGKLLEYAEGKVKLQRTDGKVITLPFVKLSAADQFYVETKKP